MIELLKPEEAAETLRTTPGRLAKMRVTGTGPRFIKDGRRVLYSRADVESWIDENTRAKAGQL